MDVYFRHRCQTPVVSFPYLSLQLIEVLLDLKIHFKTLFYPAAETFDIHVNCKLVNVFKCTGLSSPPGREITAAYSERSA